MKRVEIRLRYNVIQNEEKRETCSLSRIRFGSLCDWLPWRNSCPHRLIEYQGRNRGFQVRKFSWRRKKCLFCHRQEPSCLPSLWTRRKIRARIRKGERKRMKRNAWRNTCLFLSLSVICWKDINPLEESTSSENPCFLLQELFLNSFFFSFLFSLLFAGCFFAFCVGGREREFGDRFVAHEKRHFAP